MAPKATVAQRHRPPPAAPIVLVQEVLGAGDEPWLRAWAHRLPTRDRRAAAEFDRRHTKHARRCTLTSAALWRDPTSLSKQHALRAAAWELRVNRYHTNEPLQQVRRYMRRASMQLVWRLETSIWAPRASTCDSRALHETVKCERAAFEADWRRALEGGLARFIVSHDDGDDDGDDDRDASISLGRRTQRGQGGRDEGAGRARADDTLAAEAEEVREVKHVLWRHQRLIHSLFEFYAALTSSEDVFHLRFNAWGNFVSDFGLIDAESNLAAWDRLFIAVDAATTRSAAASTVALAKQQQQQQQQRTGRKDKQLDRAEFLHCLARAGVMRYVLSGECADVSSAVARLFEDVLCPRADPKLFATADAYRAAHTYVEPVDVVLRRHEATLRLVYEQTCALYGSNNALARRMAGVYEWRTFLKLFGLLAADLTERDATLAFAACRMRVVDLERRNGLVRHTHLTFEDFLEALCRVAGLKALPTDEEVAAAGSGNAGTHLLRMASDSPPDYERLLNERATLWGSPPALQPLARCVEHLCHMMIVHCQGGLRRPPNAKMALTVREVQWGFKKNKK